MQNGIGPDGTIPPPPGGVLYKKNQVLPAHLTRRGRRQRRRSCACNQSRCCMTSLWSILIFLIVAIGIAILVFWLFVRPKSPHYTVGNVRLTGLDPKALATATKIGTLSTETTFTIEARNPNSKIGYYYDKISVEADILGVNIGKAEPAPFFQGHDNTTFLTNDLKSGPLSVIELTQTGVFGASQAGAVPLELKMYLKYESTPGSTYTRARVVVYVRHTNSQYPFEIGECECDFVDEPSTLNNLLNVTNRCGWIPKGVGLFRPLKISGGYVSPSEFFPFQVKRTTTFLFTGTITVKGNSIFNNHRLLGINLSEQSALALKVTEHFHLSLLLL